MILIIDNYDSFTYNLVQYIGELNFHVEVVRNDAISLNHIAKKKPTHIIISPGPGGPSESGISLEIIKTYAYAIPILGVCLGHQSIGYIYGGKITRLKEPIHGKVSEIYHNNSDIFSQVPNPFLATRYHSLVIDQHQFPNDLNITAYTKDGAIMGCQHKIYTQVRGIQFHPESLWTNSGKLILRNFLSLNRY
uniref:Anthranilate synthase component 2 n=1 Tax=Rhodogorgon sp. TaxID=2485824 RepID=A0A3G3MI89_9FLOR|nr:anthranilate synthase component 2 [Rhodogorgon sp.]